MEKTKTRFQRDDKQLIYNIVGSIVIKGLAIVISLISTPLYIKYFNDNTILGVWFTLLSILTIILNFDFGIGNGLRNKLVYSLKEKDETNINKLISSSYILTAGLSIIFLIICIPIILIIDWNSFLKLTTDIVAPNVLTNVILITFFSIIIQLFLKTITFILYALQKAAINNFLSLITNIFVVFTIFIFPSSTNEVNLLRLSILRIFAISLPYLVTTLFIFSTSLKKYIPRFKKFDSQVAKEVLTLGSGIFYNQIMYMLLTSVNTLLITRIWGATVVVEHEIYYKVFYLVPTLFTLLLAPLWSAVTKMHAEKKYYKLLNYFKFTLILGVFVSLFEFFIILFLQFGFDIWLGDETIIVSLTLAFSFATFGSVFIIQNILSTFAMGLNKVKTQSVLYTIAIILKFSLVFSLKGEYQSWALLIIVDSIVFTPYIIAEYITTRRQIINLQQLNGKIRIYYIAHYDLLEKDNCRNVAASAVNWMNYILSKLDTDKYDIIVVSPAQPDKPGSYNAEKTQITKGITLKLFSSFYAPWKLFKAVRELILSIKLIFYITFNISKNDIVFFYHSPSFLPLYRFVRIFINNRVVLHIGEIYGDVSNNSKLSLKENLAIRKAKAIITNVDTIKSRFKNEKMALVVYGVYNTTSISKDKFNDGLTHLVYSGTLSNTKMGALMAIEAGQYLDCNYVLHILGRGSKNEVELINKRIGEISALSSCKIIYEGSFYGKKYEDFLSKCDIGLALQVSETDFSDTSFPSKIITYLSAGLKVISSSVSGVKKTIISEYVFFHYTEDPSDIAKVIIQTKNSTNYGNPLPYLDNEITTKLPSLLESL